jgi:hypothetical protein
VLLIHGDCKEISQSSCQEQLPTYSTVTKSLAASSQNVNLCLKVGKKP